MADPTADELLGLLDVVYETAMDPQGWDRALERFAQVFDGTAAVFFVQDQAESSLTFSRLWGRPTATLREYEEEFAALDIAIGELIARGPGAVLTEQYLPSKVRQSSRFFSEFRGRWEIERFLGGTIFRDDRRVGILGVQGEASRRPFDDAERVHLQRVLPHVRRAVQLRSQFDVQAESKRSFEEVAESLAVGVLLLNSIGEATFVNASARRVLARQDGLGLVERKLLASSKGDNDRLWRAISAALGVASGDRIDSNDAVHVNRRGSAQAYNVLVLPAGSAGGVISPVFGAANVIVLIGDPDTRLQSPPELLARLYGLTPAEAKLAHAVASGERLETYADRAGIAVSTVRWTLKQIQTKTGCRRQVDLVRLLLTGPASLLGIR